MSCPIERYAMIGDCETAGLVSTEGSIDWLCLPRFDSGACFASLVGTPENGHWQIVPAGDILAVRRRYRDDTLVLETEFETAQGVVRLVDFMSVRAGSPAVVRIIEGVRGRVAMQTELVVRFDYGSVLPWVQQLPDAGGIRATAGPDTLYCRSPVKLRGEGMATVATFDIAAGERVPFTLTWSQTHLPEPARVDADEALAACETWWREWSGRCTFRGEWRDAVVRSLITLKAMTYAPTGGIVAAVTTSLPERLGGVRNWDYRYCWVRDATFTLLAMNVGGYTEEACAWRQWLVNAVAGDPARMQIMYGVAGERRLPEWNADWLAGYEGSTPVRIGNAAHSQQQLDVYGELMDALYQSRVLGLPEDAEAWALQRALLRHLEAHWQEPDQSLWEIRGEPQQFTHSNVMAWVAFDRAVKSVERFGLSGDIDKWRRVRAQIHEQVCSKGFDAALNAFVQHYGSKSADASLLLLPIVGFLPPDDPRVIGTIEFIQQRLKRDGLIMRHENLDAVDGLPTGEGTFLLCSFWLADTLALSGRRQESRELFEKLLALRNDVGLLAEEYEPRSQRMLGNFPQAFSHIGLINTARNLQGNGDAPVEHRRCRST